MTRQKKYGYMFNGAARQTYLFSRIIKTSVVASIFIETVLGWQSNINHYLNIITEHTTHIHQLIIRA